MLRRIPPKNMEVPWALPVGLHHGDGREALHGGEALDDQIPALFSPHAISPVFHPLPLRQLHPLLPWNLLEISEKVEKSL